MTTEQLRDKYEQENGIRCITPKGDGDIRYVEWLEGKTYRECASPELLILGISIAAIVDFFLIIWWLG